jgi:hypothetical protein
MLINVVVPTRRFWDFEMYGWELIDHYISHGDRSKGLTVQNLIWIWNHAPDASSGVEAPEPWVGVSPPPDWDEWLDAD